MMSVASRVMGVCTPGLTAPCVPCIDLAALKAQGIEAILLDLDNTLVRWRGREVGEDVVAWVQAARDAGFGVCIVSNAGDGRRVEPVARALGIPFLVRAAKPRRSAFRRAAAMLQVPPSKVAVVGDQLLTDVVGGNRAGMFTVLVTPMDLSHEFVGTKCMRVLERYLQRHMK